MVSARDAEVYDLISKWKKAFRPWPAVDGATIGLDPLHQPPSGAKAYATWTVTCPLHDNCKNHKTVTVTTTDVYGDVQPLAFLHAWSLLPPHEIKQHNSNNPNDAEVAAVVAVPGNVAMYEMTIEDWRP